MKTRIIIILMLLLPFATVLKAQNKVDVNSTKVNSMLKTDKTLIVIDVRTAEEFNAGHIKGAINIDIRQPNAFAKIDKLNKKAKYIVHCRTNNRSKTAVDYMMKSGFNTVYQMIDGFVGWSQNNLPIVK
jgi:phage shock protein E